MAVSLNQAILELPPESQGRVKRKAEKLKREYESLQEFRRSVGWTQEDLAEKLEIKQTNISKLEGRGDMN